MTVRAARVVETVGGGRVGKNPDDAVAQIRSGLPYSALEAVVRDFRLELKEILPVLDIPWTTFMRRKRARRFRPDESDRVYRLARIVTMAASVLESRERAVRWLREPNRALGGERPLQLLDTEVGARQVETVLGRIEHGTYS